MRRNIRGVVRLKEELLRVSNRNPHDPEDLKTIIDLLVESQVETFTFLEELHDDVDSLEHPHQYD